MTVTLSPGSRNFEVTSGDTLVVSGQYSLDDTVPSTKDNEEEDLGDQLILKPDGIYKVPLFSTFNLKAVLLI